VSDRFPFSDADPSWYRKVLDTLARDHPKISEEVWGKTISENAERLQARKEEEARRASLYSGKCAECTTGVTCEDAEQCLFEG
jgi:hypothetical protein